VNHHPLIDTGDSLSEIPAKWKQPPAELISKIPKGGTTLDYMGHADVTLALIEVDPMFGYDWLRDDTGMMLIRHVGKRLVIEGHLTVLGVTRPCVGTCQDNKMEPEKELIGDMLRNGAMRFGIATALWSKSDAHESQEGSERYQTPAAPPAAASPLDGRVRAVLADFGGLSDDDKAELKTWASGRSLAGSELRGDETWLENVEAWIDERKAVEA